MCKIDGCQGKVVARGMCAKHYMRERRTGDPEKTGKPGRPRERSPYMAAAQMVNDQWSPRTMARYAEATRILHDCSAPSRERILRSCIRANGSINVSQLLDLAAMLWAEEHPDED